MATSNTGAPLRISIDGFLKMHFLGIVKIQGWFSKNFVFQLAFLKVTGSQEPVLKELLI